ncbi:LysR family transcriptional regulator [Alkalihalobacillus pseudalcaliphilus]|uniref:LysR family transcriptional regulator n=1 Tax=Alkalihalobacillus pseudalcaliphilus TaxID=79884 RepID=UPI00064E0677|nr:LysR family transcriptional regulator [Alkalihalobacillus pseudalcaliphilus]KMK76903.1 hypothetical protein AB990_08410 [Alkalihalobacillus pseudalcaliphilus]
MDIKALYYFKVIVEKGSISKAAHFLHMAQPPLSQQLKKLEQEMEATLIKRYREKWEVTEAGHVLYRHANDILNQMSKIKDEIVEIAGGLKGTLSIGVASSCITMLPKAIKLFKKQYPSIHLKLIQGDSAFIQEKLERQEIDCGIVLSPEKREHFHYSDLPAQPIVAIIPAAWKSGFQQEKISTIELIEQPIILLSPLKGYDIAEDILNHLKTFSSPLQVILECQDIPTIISLIANEVGLSIIPKPDLDYIKRQAVSILELSDFSRKVQPVLVTNQLTYINQATHNFIQCVTESTHS